MPTKAFLKKIKQRLTQERDELHVKSHQRVDIDTDGDETDEVQGHMLLDLANQLSARDSVKLAQINKALKEIDNGSFGICDDCEENIPDKRLDANPYSSICVSCAEERELETKRRGL
jgi:DnaK suppressor protein